MIGERGGREERFLLLLKEKDKLREGGKAKKIKLGRNVYLRRCSP